MNPGYLLTVAFLHTVKLALAQEGSSKEKMFKAPDSVVLAHGVLMAVLFIMFFPLGAIILRISRSPHAVWIHAGWQVVSYIAALASFGMGVWLATKEQKWTTSNGHPIIGTIVIGFLLFQPLGGWIHHKEYKRRTGANGDGGTTLYGITHRWLGRLMLVLGVINGGLGLQLFHADNNFIIPYSVIGAVVYLVWSVIVIWKRKSTAAPIKKGAGLEEVHA